MYLGVIPHHSQLDTVAYLGPDLLNRVFDVVTGEAAHSEVPVDHPSGGTDDAEYDYRLGVVPSAVFLDGLALRCPVPLDVGVDTEDGLVTLQELVLLVLQGLDPCLQLLDLLHLLLGAR